MHEIAPRCGAPVGTPKWMVIWRKHIEMDEVAYTYYAVSEAHPGDGP